MFVKIVFYIANKTFFVYNSCTSLSEEFVLDMKKGFKLKDSLYYSDLMYEIQKIAEFDMDVDFSILERITERKKDIREDNTTNDTLTGYCLSPFQIELFEIVREISKKANVSFYSVDEIKNYPLLVLEQLAILDKKNRENILVNHLMSLVKEMGLEHAFSLGEDAEQCVCLTKKEEMWEVYMIERGMSFEKDVFEDCYDACLQVLNHLADSKKSYEESKENFSLIKKLIPNK